MPIQGLREIAVEQPVSVADDVGAAIEALDMLGLVEDRAAVTESVSADFAGLAESSGRSGELYVQIPRSLVALDGLVAVLDSDRFERDYPQTHVWPELWVPGKHPDGYKAEELGNLERGQTDTNWPPHARLAVHNPDSPHDPLLHFLGLPFDEMYREDGQQTQLEAIDEAAGAYEADYPDNTMRPLNAAAVTMIGLQRRIKGEPMPIRRGFMRDATLERKSVGGYSCVGGVYSDDGPLALGESGGHADPAEGVGLSVGPKEL